MVRLYGSRGHPHKGGEVGATSLDESLLVCQGYKYLKMENSDHHVESLA